MSKFIELTAYGQKRLFNAGKIECVHSGSDYAKVLIEDTLLDVEESYETVKSLLAEEQKPKVTAEEVEAAVEAFYERCTMRDCKKCNYILDNGKCDKYRFVADYINRKAEGK